MSRLRGFTLLEMLVVIGLMGLLAAIVVPRVVSGNDYYTMGANLRSVASALRATRALAIEAQGDKVLRFDLENKTYQIDTSSPKDIAPDIDINVFTSEAEISEDGRFAGIRFYGDGASGGGRVTLGLNDDKRAVDIVWMTGQVNILSDIGDD